MKPELLHRRSLAVGPNASKGSDLDADAVRVGIDVRLRRSDPQRTHAAERREPLEHGVRECLLKVEPPRSSDLLHLLAEEIVVPRALGIVAGGARRVLEPDFDA